SESPESGSSEKVPNGPKMEIFGPFRTFSELLFNIVNACAVGWMSENSDLFRNKNFDSGIFTLQRRSRNQRGKLQECCSNVPNLAQHSERCCNIPATFQWQRCNLNVAGMLLEHCNGNITCECCRNVAGTLQRQHCGLWPFPN
ncbi:hypothetical protein PV326_013584, partial [Microctonus aethiopoides]